MSKKIHHLYHYIVLFVILLTSMLLFWNTRNMPQVQAIIMIGTAISYTIWGIMHHVLVEGHVNLKVVIEYILISSIGLVMLLGVLTI